MFHKKSKIYAIADQETCNKYDISILDFVRAVQQSGIEIIQYRNKIDTAETVKAIFEQILNITFASTIMIINDYPVIADNFQTWLHVGQQDSKETHKVPYGRSTHSIKEVEHALKENPMPEYIGFGAVFKSKTKSDINENFGLIGDIEKLWNRDIVFIGGITGENIHLLPYANRIYYAIISDFFSNGSNPLQIERCSRNLVEKTMILP